MCRCCEPSEILSRCCEPSFLIRRYISKKEEKENLEKYRDALKKELQGIEEHLSELK